ncbi:septum formation family protein [Dactylosporangium sp. NPDC049742]|uniref:septum formation family protein n=1 Tax=Dactylosporangium sp. NPDC049742 TaxID=3154737 RepID=UPI003424767E
MRRGRRVTVAILCVAGALAGCGTPAGTDGDLTNGWPALPAASYSPPAQGSCLQGAVAAFEPSASPLRAVDCAEPHAVEVVGGGTVPDAPAPPAWDSDPSRAAYAECDKAATAYLGGDWRTGRLFPVFRMPAAATWQAGGRRYLCGIAEASDDLFAPQERTGSVKGGLSGGKGPLALACVQLSGGDLDAKGFYGTVDAVKPVACDAPHDTEFVGAWTAPAGEYPPQQKLKELAGDACYLKIAQFLGLSQTQLFQRADIYTFWTGLTANQWALGDRTAHCFLNVSSKTPLRVSVRDLGTKQLP